MHITALHQQSLYADCCIMEGWYPSIHPKSCSHAGTFPSFDKTNIIRTVKTLHYQTDPFPSQYMHESTTDRKYIFLLIWKPQGFSVSCRGKEETNNGYFLWTLLLNTSRERLERTGISTIQTIVFTCCLQFILFSFVRYCGRGAKKSVALYTWKRKIKMLLVEAQK